MSDRRETSRPEVNFVILNPEVRLSQQAIEAIARLLLSTETDQEHQESVAA